MSAPPKSLSGFLDGLAQAHHAHPLPPGLRASAERCADECLAILFPHFRPTACADRASVDLCVEHLRVALTALVAGLAPMADDAALDADRVTGDFIAALPGVRELLLLDAEAHFLGDPAARSVDEVILAYPGFRAVALYRVANHLHRAGVPLLPRLITEQAHRETGIDIHPGASIGRAFSIDHGTGVVIGETTIIGDRVKLYQGVTLGAASVRKELADVKRHPTVGDDVVIYANATILGGDTVIGASSVIGGNVWLTHGVPAGSIVSHAGASERQRTGDNDIPTDH
ncbi:MAG: serine O-acetyltransferase [Gemmatimonadaceae bacterium]